MDGAFVDGDAVGSSVEKLVGFGDGAGVSLIDVGLRVIGMGVGFIVGALLGIYDGKLVGLIDGDHVGDEVIGVGYAVGANVTL